MHTKPDNVAVDDDIGFVLGHTEILYNVGTMDRKKCLFFISTRSISFYLVFYFPRISLTYVPWLLYLLARMYGLDDFFLLLSIEQWNLIFGTRIEEKTMVSKTISAIAECIDTEINSLAVTFADRFYRE